MPSKPHTYKKYHAWGSTPKKKGEYRYFTISVTRESFYKDDDTIVANIKQTLSQELDNLNENAIPFIILTYEDEGITKYKYFVLSKYTREKEKQYYIQYYINKAIEKNIFQGYDKQPVNTMAIAKQLENHPPEKHKKYRKHAMVFDTIADVTFVLKFATNFLSNFPPINIIMQWITGIVMSFAYAIWFIAIIINPTIADPAFDETKKTTLQKIKSLHFASTFMIASTVIGLLAGILLATLTIIAIPYALPIALICITVSNALWTTATIKEWLTEIKSDNNDNVKKQRVYSKACYAAYTSCGTLSMLCLAIAGFLTIAFPPAAAAIFVVGMIFSGLCAISWVGYAGYRMSAAKIKSQMSWKEYLKSLLPGKNKDLNVPQPDISPTATHVDSTPEINSQLSHAIRNIKDSINSFSTENWPTFDIAIKSIFNSKTLTITQLPDGNGYNILHNQQPSVKVIRNQAAGELTTHFIPQLSAKNSQREICSLATAAAKTYKEIEQNSNMQVSFEVRLTKEPLDIASTAEKIINLFEQADEDGLKPSLNTLARKVLTTAVALDDFSTELRDRADEILNSQEHDTNSPSPRNN